jgi:hypothetical protein
MAASARKAGSPPANPNIDGFATITEFHAAWTLCLFTTRLLFQTKDTNGPGTSDLRKRHSPKTSTSWVALRALPTQNGWLSTGTVPFEATRREHVATTMRGRGRIHS